MKFCKVSLLPFQDGRGRFELQFLVSGAGQPLCKLKVGSEVQVAADSKPNVAENHYVWDFEGNFLVTEVNCIGLCGLLQDLQ